MLTCFACIVLQKESATLYHRIIPLIGIFICLFQIISSTWTNILFGFLVLLAGIPVYVFFSPKEEIHHLKEMFLSEESIFIRRIEEKERFLANFIHMVYRLFHRPG